MLSKIKIKSVQTDKYSKNLCFGFRDVYYVSSIQKSRIPFKVINDVNRLRILFHNPNYDCHSMLKWLHSINFKATSILRKNDNNVIWERNTEIEDDCGYTYENPNNDEKKLIIQNDKNFKISLKPKPKPIKTEAEIKNIIKKKKIKISKIESPKVEEIDIFNEIRIECKFFKKSTPTIVEDKIIEESENNENVNRVAETNVENASIKDLSSGQETLLIMMTLTPNSNKADELKLPSCETDTNEEVTQPDINIETLTLPSQLIRSNSMKTVLNISPIRTAIQDKEVFMIKKYVRKWIDYVKNRRKYLSQQRQQTLNMFLDKLAKKKISINKSFEPHNKSKIVANDYSTYQHRYKMQKHIIALQKAKLEEQNRLIEELKYNKIVENSRLSVDAMRDEVRKTYFEIDRQLRPKIKCLTNELKIPDIDASSLVLHCLKVPQFLQRMEKRAREREEKHAMIRERRRQMEEERVRLKQQTELAKAEMDKEEKVKRIKELRDKRKREKIESIRKKQFAERIRALTVMADLHYEKYLMNKYGIRPFMKLIEIKRDNMEKAKSHYTFQLKKNVFFHFMWYTEDMWFERTYKAVEFYRKTLLNKVFEGFRRNHHEYVLKKQVAEDYYDLYLTQLVFRGIYKATQLSKKETELKYNKAVIYHNWNIIFKTFTCWRTLPALNALKKEQEVRKSRWRQRVLQVVPDYTPPDE